MPRANGDARSSRRSAAEPGQNGHKPGWLPIRTYYAWHVPKVRIVYSFARKRQTWLLLKLVPFVGSTEAGFPIGDLGPRSSASRALPRNQCVFRCRRCNTGRAWLPTCDSGPFSPGAPCTHVPGRYLSKIPVSMVRNKKRPLAGVLGANWVHHWKCDPHCRYNAREAWFGA
jgi:hypothetical protein